MLGTFFPLTPNVRDILSTDPQCKGHSSHRPPNVRDILPTDPQCKGHSSHEHHCKGTIWPITGCISDSPLGSQAWTCSPPLLRYGGYVLHWLL
ncbi:unnamed protein product, partial [Staurois parvus]